MKPLLFVVHLFVIAPAILGQSFGLDFANVSLPGTWSAQSVVQVLTWVSFFGSLTLLMITAGCRLFRQCIPVALERRPRD